MSWAHLIDAAIFVIGTLAGFAIAVWVEVRSTAYADDFNKRLRNWDHRLADGVPCLGCRDCS